MNTITGVWRQRLGYGVSDFSCNLIWQMITLYLMFFYTDVMGLALVQVSVLFLVTRIVDGITDIIMGVIIDKTNTRWGKSRPYFLLGAIPFGLLAILAFYVPDIGPVGKIVYAYLTYIGLSTAYTMVNVPMASILPSLTSDEHERTNLATVRIIFSFIGATAVSAITLPLVNALGNGSQAQGFFWTMVIFAIIATLFFFVTFKNVEEKVKLRQEKVTVKQAFSSLKGNTPWLIFAVNIVFMWGSHFFMQGALIYYFTYNVERPELASVVASIGAFVPIIGTFATPFISKKMYKRTWFMIASTINLIGIIIMLIANVNIAGLIMGAVIAALGFGARQSIYFSMQADPVDYGEWKTGISAAGLMMALNGFIGKVALAVAGALSGLFLSWGNYVPNQTQTSSALFAIKMNYLIIPACMVVISMIIMCFYNLDKIYSKIRAEINARNIEKEETIENSKMVKNA
ncbi:MULTISPECIES: MFS transporter [Metabacillus]|jgi:glycoside/pentoside/hexuronide:cation symporter, GPH family|uniref:Sugar transporter n=3 Tax=Metabacillus TaxID=2675233 RepID=A0A179SLL9_9BACI|nr:MULTISPECIES: glycoside-pentoside-hexuronide (GPH):cation symporter [Metabacillus]OAS82587.1 sugar transporter [Metabacillus litoralis]QNF26774.1 MFS transporter [Metabacillus sp. KUDC1714]